MSKRLRAGALLSLLAVAVSPLQAWTEEPSDFSTPRRALRHFIESARAGDFAAAAQALDLGVTVVDEASADRQVPPEMTARELKLVLDSQLWIDWEKVSDAREGDAADGPDADVLGAIPLDGAPVPVRLVRHADGQWRIGPGIVAAVPRLYTLYGPGWLGEHLPAVLFSLRWIEIQAWQWIGLALGGLFASGVGILLGAALRRLFLRVTRRTRARWDDTLVEAGSGPARLLLGVITFYLVERWLRLAVPARETLEMLLRVVAIGTLTWAALRALSFVAAVMVQRLVEGQDKMATRGAVTQITVLQRVLGVVVLFVGGALILLQFDGMRAVGTSLLASAGVAGLVIGLAAQRSIGTLLAGIQISFTQPIRVGDVVILEGEWGTVEEITLTYVVVKIWDLRRLIVPITKILDGSFQNWTRSSPEILGTVFLRADYIVPIAVVRAEVERFVKTSPDWDGKVAGLQVTDATEKTVELRALVSSADASKNWDLRCALREHLVGFLQQLEGGRYLPRTRIEAPATQVQPVLERRPAHGERPVREG